MSKFNPLDAFRNQYFQTAKPGELSLTQEAAAFRANFMANAAPDKRDALLAADAELAATGIVERAIKVGDIAPDFVLPDARGGQVRLADLLARGPVVVSFYRGTWCPYCNLELRALERALPDFTRLGASLVAVSPMTPDNSLTAVEKNALSYPVLSDTGCAAARAWGLAFDLAEPVKAVYDEFGHVLTEINGMATWTLPIPATYLIDRHGRVVLAYVDVDYRGRLDPIDIIVALEALPAT